MNRDTVYIELTSPTNLIFDTDFDDLKFNVVERGNDAGFYDLLFDKDGDLIGVTWTSHENELFDMINSEIDSSRYIYRVDNSLVIKFGVEPKEVEYDYSDQLFLDNNVYRSYEGVFVISFSLTSLTGQEVNSMSQYLSRGN